MCSLFPRSLHERSKLKAFEVRESHQCARNRRMSTCFQYVFPAEQDESLTKKSICDRDAFSALTSSVLPKKDSKKVEHVSGMVLIPVPVSLALAIQFRGKRNGNGFCYSHPPLPIHALQNLNELSRPLRERCFHQQQEFVFKNIFERHGSWL